MIRRPPCEDPSRRTPQPQVTQTNERSDRPEELGKLALARLRVVDTIE